MIEDQAFKALLKQYVEQVAESAFNALFKIKLGSFVKYSATDTFGRFADIQLYNSDKTPDDLPLVPTIIENVPLYHYGTRSAQTDFDLVLGDEMLIMFIDDSTDEWRVPGGNIPKFSEREDKHSIDFSIAFPISTFHNQLTSSLLNHYQIKLQTGKKLQIGIANPGTTTFSIELIQEIYTVFNAINSIFVPTPPADGDSFLAAFQAVNTTYITPLLTKLQTLGSVV